MPKRTFWLMTGAVVGAGSTLWAERKVRQTWHQTAARLQADAIVVEVGRSARQVAGSAGDRVRGAVSSGRDEMLRREEELWAELAAQGVEPDPPILQPADHGVRAGPSPLPQGRIRMARFRRPMAKSAFHLGN